MSDKIVDTRGNGWTQKVYHGFTATGHPFLQKLRGLLVIPGLSHDGTPAVGIINLEDETGEISILRLEMDVDASEALAHGTLKVTSVAINAGREGYAIGWALPSFGLHGYRRIPLHWEIRHGEAQSKLSHLDARQYEDSQPFFISTGDPGVSWVAINGEPYRYWHGQRNEKLPVADKSADHILTGPWRDYTVNGENGDGSIIVGAEIIHSAGVQKSRPVAWSNTNGWKLRHLGEETSRSSEAFAITPDGLTIVGASDGIATVWDGPDSSKRLAEAHTGLRPSWACDIARTSGIVLINWGSRDEFGAMEPTVCLSMPLTGVFVSLAELYREGDRGPFDQFTAIAAIEISPTELALVGVSNEGATVVTRLTALRYYDPERQKVVPVEELLAQPTA